MVRNLLPLVLSGFTFACMSGGPQTFKGSPPGGPPVAGAADGDSPFPYTLHRAVLEPNGLTVLVLPMPSDGLVSYWTLVRTGSRDEAEPGVTGFAHFFEHMMFRGSEKYPGKVYDEIVNGMGADSNAYTTDDYTAYHLTFAKEDLPTVVEIESDRFQNLQYDETQFKTEAGAVYGEFRKGRTNPFEVLYEKLLDTAFDKHTYKHTTIGFEADIVAMPEHFDYSKGFFRRFYRPDNCVILITGDVDPKKAIELVHSKYKDWKRGYVPPAVMPEPNPTARRTASVVFDGETLPILALGFRGERFMPEDRVMMAGLLVGELAFGETSALYKKLVLEEQIVEKLLTDIEPKRDPGLWTVFAMTKGPEHLPRVEREIGISLDEMRARPISRERLDEIRAHWKYRMLSSLSTPSQVARTLAPLAAITGDLTCVFEIFATLDQVTPEDVRRAVAQYFRPERCTAVTLVGKDTKLPEPPPESGDLVLLPVQEDPNVAIKFWVKAGSQDDPPGKEGLAALTAALLAEGGTRKLAYDEILARLFPMAASYSASVDKEMTVLSGLTHQDNAGLFYALLSSALLDPGFRPEDFERLRARALTGIEKVLRYSSDEELGKAALEGVVFAGTPYGHLIEGTVEGLRGITLEDVKEFYARHYTRGNVIGALGGSYAPSLPGDVAADLQRLPAGKPAAPTELRVARKPGRRVTIVEKPGPSTAISIGAPIDVLRGSKDFYALSIARSWLGEHRNSFSHLYQVIREARGLNYGAYAYIEKFPNGGRHSMPPTGVGRRVQLFELWIRPVQEKNAVFALRAALREVENLTKNGMTREQFEAARTFLGKYCLHYAETTADRLGYALDDRFYGIPANPGHLAMFRAKMSELTLEDVNTAIRKHLQTDDLEIAIVTEHAAAMRDALVSGAPSPVDYGGKVQPKEILAEDKAIESYALRIAAENVAVIPVQQMFVR